MKILYAIQGTGNGHVSRSREIVPLLKQMADVDVLISGTEHEVELPFEVNHQVSGFGFVFGNHGGINYWKTLTENNFVQFFKNIFQFPVQQYDLVINDFEPVTAWACKLKNVPCISLSHQAAVLHPKAPKTKGFDPFAWLVLRYYAPAALKFGFHFKAYADGIYPPVIRKLIRNSEPTNEGHYTCYLPAYNDEHLKHFFNHFQEVSWHVFSKRCKEKYQAGNVTFFPVDQTNFQKSFSSCTGFLCGAGFEGPAEAVYLKKKVLVVPMQGQYEQQLNAAAIHELGVPVVQHLDNKSIATVKEWILSEQQINIDLPDQTESILHEVLDAAAQKWPLQIAMS